MTAVLDPTPDGQGFILVRQAPAGQEKIVVVENRAAGLKRRP
jgi:hypothetical protein